MNIKFDLISEILYVILIVVIWFASAYFHESDMIYACNKGEEYTFLHRDYVMTKCEVPKVDK
jgi:hypothetical protein